MAQFKTAYLQRMVPVDVVVVGAITSESGITNAATRKQAICVGDLVTYTAETATVSAYIGKAASLAAATHIVAQSDMTIADGHVPTDRRDYRYSDFVAPTNNVAPTDKTKPIKKVALYPIWDKEDIVLAADGSDLNS